MSPNRVVITGASGFIGSALCSQLAEDFTVRGVVRRPGSIPSAFDPYVIESIDGSTDWGMALQDVDAVIHCAARVHVMKDSSQDPLKLYRATNVDGTLRLAEAALQAGVRRFIFLSTVKVYGEQSFDTPFNSKSPLAPEDPYGLSKLEAEQGLRELAASGLELVIIRPPLVYGPGVKGNFESLCRWVAKGVPLPLGGLKNRRSLVSIYNLVNLIQRAVESPLAVGQVLLPSDGEPVSTTELLREVARSVEAPVRLVPFPESLLRLGAKLCGWSERVERLLGNMEIDGFELERQIGWSPKLSLRHSLERMQRELDQ